MTSEETDAMLPTQTPTKMMALVSCFFVCPPTLEVMSDNPITNDAWYEPVR